MEYIYRTFKRPLFAIIIFLQFILVISQLIILLTFQGFYTQEQRIKDIQTENSVLLWSEVPQQTAPISTQLQKLNLDSFVFDSAMVSLNRSENSSEISVFSRNQNQTLKLTPESVLAQDQVVALYVDDRVKSDYPIGSTVEVSEFGMDNQYTIEVFGYIDTSKLQPIYSESTEYVIYEGNRLFAVEYGDEQPFELEDTFRQRRVEIAYGKQSILEDTITEFDLFVKDIIPVIKFNQDIVQIDITNNTIFLCVYIFGLLITLFFIMQQELDIYRKLFSVKSLIGARNYRLAMELITPYLGLAFLSYIIVGIYFNITPIIIYSSRVENHFTVWTYLIVGLITLIIFIIEYILAFRSIQKLQLSKNVK